MTIKDKVFLTILAIVLAWTCYLFLSENKGEKYAKEYVRHGDITFSEYK